MKKGVFGKAIVLAAIVGLLGTRAAFAQVDDGDVPRGGLENLAIGTLIGTVGGEEAFADADLVPLLPAGDPNSGRGSRSFQVKDAKRGDRGSCGNIWANDTFDVIFHVKRDDEGPGQYTLVEQFKNGSFVTSGMQPSPGSCNNATLSKAGILPAGVQGRDHGKATFNVNCNNPVNPNCFDPNANGGQGCTPTTLNPNPCGNTAAFCRTFFTSPPATCTLASYSFDYRSNDPTLVQRKWHDSFKNNQLNQFGDICQSNCGAGAGEDAHGDGDMAGGRGNGHFHSEEDGPKYSRNNNEQYDDALANEHFRSTQVNSVELNDLTRVLTVSGTGVNQLGVAVDFVIVETAPTLAAPGLYSITLSDGYANSGSLLSGTITLG
jgi:hypothetical protein